MRGKGALMGNLLGSEFLRFGVTLVMVPQGIYSPARKKFYSKFIGCFLKYLKNYKDFESNQYYIEKHYQNATKNQKGNFKFLKFHGFLDAFLKN